MKRLLITLVVLLALLFVFGRLTYHTLIVPEEHEPVNLVHYQCDNGKRILAEFSEGVTLPSRPDESPTPGGRARLTLPDGSRMQLLQTISADGARYANPDESFVFWSKGDGAMVLQNGQEKEYTNCIATQS